jgi:hypothetical protein
MDFRRPAAAADADRLIFLPPFPWQVPARRRKEIKKAKTRVMPRRAIPE